MSDLRNDSVHRIIDANLNRVKEGLRVCEEITRFILDDRKLTALFKLYRHEIDAIVKKIYPVSRLLAGRRSAGDVGRKNSRFELERSGLKDVFWANIQRVKESLRVLEEFSKLKNREAALCFKELRYKIYEIEKKSFKKISALPDIR
ncbi:thiamine-phosphate pyrophosphorylase [bacterium]|nr:MAG: thiamine-phosphate pyrophosphorylase [bacterium]